MHFRTPSMENGIYFKMKHNLARFCRNLSSLRRTGPEQRPKREKNKTTSQTTVVATPLVCNWLCWHTSDTAAYLHLDSMQTRHANTAQRMHRTGNVKGKGALTKPQCLRHEGAMLTSL